MAFRQCENLRFFYADEHLEHIGNECFAFCTKLEKINLPLSVKKIGHDCFRSCISLEKFNIL